MNCLNEVYPLHLANMPLKCPLYCNSFPPWSPFFDSVYCWKKLNYLPVRMSGICIWLIAFLWCHFLYFYVPSIYCQLRFFWILRLWFQFIACVYDNWRWLALPVPSCQREHRTLWPTFSDAKISPQIQVPNRYPFTWCIPYQVSKQIVI